MTLPLDQVKVVDADTHMTERHDLWTSRAPAALQDRVPARRADRRRGARGSSSGAVLGRAGAGGVVDKRRQQGPVVRGPLRVGDRAGPRRGATTRSPASQLLDEIGDLGAGHLPGRRRPRRAERSATSCTTSRCATSASRSSTTRNAEIQAESGNRLLPMAILPAWDIDACVREVAARARPRPARREPHVRSAGPRRARPREPRVGPGVGSVRSLGTCRCTSTSARASRR